MANGAGQVSGTRAPRRPLGPPGQRLLLALFVSLLATIAVCVPLAYQARSARDGGIEGPPPTTTTTASVPPSSAPPATTGSVPAQVLPTTLDRGDEHLAWASATTPQRTQPLEGATLRGQVVVQIAAPTTEPQVVKAEFWIDPATATAPENVDETPPFTLGADDATGSSFDTTILDDGPHTVAVKALQADGTTVEHSSRFQVDNG
jgi:hypothetical protein